MCHARPGHHIWRGMMVVTVVLVTGHHDCTEKMLVKKDAGHDVVGDA